MDETKFPGFEPPPANLLRVQAAALTMSDAMAPVRKALADAAESAAPAARAVEAYEAQQRSMGEVTERLFAVERADRQRQRDMAEATIASSELLNALVQHAGEADKREETMLLWSKVSGVAAIMASVLAIVGIVVAIFVA